MPNPKRPKKTEAKHQASDPRVAPEELQKPLPTFSATPHTQKLSETTRTPQARPESSDPFPPSFASRLEAQTDRRARQAGVSAPQGLSNREQWQWRGRSEKAGLALPGRDRQARQSTISHALGQAGAMALKAPLTLGMEAVKGTGRMALDAAKALALVVRAPVLVFVLIFVICIGLVIGLTMPKA